MILIIHTIKRKAQAISDIFHYMGILSAPSTPIEAVSEPERKYRAVLVADPDDMPDAEGLVENLRSYNPRAPIFAITNSPGRSYAHGIFNETFTNDMYSSELIEGITKYQKDRGLPITAKYTLSGIDASCDTEQVRIFDESISFTKTETMILRYLIASHPIPQDAESILRYAFKPLRKPEIASIRTHVSVMNKKSRESIGRNLLCAIPNRGYVLLVPRSTNMKEKLITV